MTKKCYGQRLKAWDKCETCLDIEFCSILTLENVYSNSKRPIELLTTEGRKLKIS